jgi:hypothetical protein
MQLSDHAKVLVSISACLVGIAGYLSIRNAVPSPGSPFAFASTLPALFVFDLNENVWPPAILFMLSCLPVVAAFVAASFHLWSGRAGIPLRSIVMLGVFAALSVAWFVGGWSYGVQYQGLSHTSWVASSNAVLLTTALALLLLNRRAPRFGLNLAFHSVTFVWLAWCAFPWLGELL